MSLLITAIATTVVVILIVYALLLGLSYNRLLRDFKQYAKRYPCEPTDKWALSLPWWKVREWEEQ